MNSNNDHYKQKRKAGQTPSNPQMHDQLKELGITPQSKASQASRKRPGSFSQNNHRRQAQSFDPTHPSPEPELWDQAALAIAANVAESRVTRFFHIKEKEKYSGDPDKQDNIIAQLKNWLSAHKNRAIEDIDPATLPHRERLAQMWKNLMLIRLPDDRQRYKTDFAKALDMAELLVQLNQLRNYYSHMSRMETPFDLTEKQKLKGLLLMLYAEASTRLNVRQPVRIIHDEQEANASTQKSQLDQVWGAVFFLNLFLPRSHAERLLQQLTITTPYRLKRRERNLFTYYSVRDGYSPTQLDPKGALTRELLGYLTLPPVESRAGQKALARWQAELDKQEENANNAPESATDETIRLNPFRRSDKVRHYIHTTLDELALLPEMRFMGRYQIKESRIKEKQTGAEQNGAEALGETGDEAQGMELVDIWVNETNPKPIQQANPQEGHAPQTRELRHCAYDRNMNQPEGRRFVYDMQDGNIRFQLYQPEQFKKQAKNDTVITQNGASVVQNSSAAAVTGVFRLRDFINLVYIAVVTLPAPAQSTSVSKPDHVAQDEFKAGSVRDILNRLYEWLTAYQSRLQRIADDPAAYNRFFRLDQTLDFHGENAAPESPFELAPQYYPKQLVEHLSGTTPRLESRLKARIAARRERIQELIRRNDTPPGNQKENQKKNQFKHHLPRHEQVHEILHFFIMHLGEGFRKEITRHEFVRLQKYLLQYKGEASREEIDYIKGMPHAQQNENKHSFNGAVGKLSDKGLFWQYLHQEYGQEHGADLGGKKLTHPIWLFCISEGKDKNGREEENVTSLGRLCRKILEHQLEELNAFERQLNNAHPLAENKLHEMARRLQLGLHKNPPFNAGKAHTPPEEKVQAEKAARTSGYRAAIYHAQHYSVIPQGFIQEAIGQLTKTPVRIGESKKETRYVNFAERIRQHATRVQLKDDFYKPELRYPQLVAKMQASRVAGEETGLAALSAGEKKVWKDCVKTLKDWHTHDQLCLIFAEKLAEHADIHFPPERQVDQLSQNLDEHPACIELQGQDACGHDKTIRLQLHSIHQGTRLWFSWSRRKMARIACLHYKDQELITSQDMPPLFAHYERHYREIVRALLEFEKQLYETDAGKMLKRESKNEKKGYVPFKQVISKTNITKDPVEIEAFEHLRNVALHDGSPGIKINEQKWNDIQDKILPQQAEIEVTDVGKNLLERLKNYRVQRKK